MSGADRQVRWGPLRFHSGPEEGGQPRPGALSMSRGCGAAAEGWRNGETETQVGARVAQSLPGLTVLVPVPLFTSTAVPVSGRNHFPTEGLQGSPGAAQATLPQGPKKPLPGGIQLVAVMSGLVWWPRRQWPQGLTGAPEGPGESLILPSKALEHDLTQPQQHSDPHLGRVAGLWHWANFRLREALLSRNGGHLRSSPPLSGSQRKAQESLRQQMAAHRLDYRQGAVPTLGPARYQALWETEMSSASLFSFCGSDRTSVASP